MFCVKGNVRDLSRLSFRYTSPAPPHNDMFCPLRLDGSKRKAKLQRNTGNSFLNTVLRSYWVVSGDLLDLSKGKGGLATGQASLFGLGDWLVCLASLPVTGCQVKATPLPIPRVHPVAFLA